MPRSIDEIIDYCIDSAESALLGFELTGDVESLAERDAFQEVIEFINEEEDKPRRVVKSPPVQGALSPERVREAVKKVNRRKS